jgi:hypothetical protein
VIQVLAGTASAFTGVSSVAKMKPKADDSVLIFDVVYEDGVKSSRRRVTPAELPDGDSDAQVITAIMTQDRKISEMSGHNRGAIKTISKSKS